MSKVLQEIADYIVIRDLNYIAKENRIYSYESDTDSIVRATWNYYSPAELRRVLNATLGLDCTNPELLGQFQELGRVYERTGNSEQESRAGVFNLAYNPPLTKQEYMIDAILKRLKDTGKGSFIYMEVRSIYKRSCELLGIREMKAQYANFCTKRFCRFHRLRLREYQDRPFITVLKGQSFNPYRFRANGTKVRAITTLQRLDTPSRKIRVDKVFRMNEEYKEALARSVTDYIGLRMADLPQATTIAARRYLKTVEEGYEKQKGFAKEK